MRRSASPQVPGGYARPRTSTGRKRLGLKVNSQVANWIERYAGWGIILLFCVAFFAALVASSAVLPLTLFALAIILAFVRYRSEVKAFDFWAFDEWVRTRYDAFGIAEWHNPYHAAELFCRREIVHARNEAATKMNSIMMELLKDRSHKPALHADYAAAQGQYNQCNTALGRELLGYLRRGDLFAKGLLVKNDDTKAERIIPTSRWRVMDIDASKAEASGPGWRYIGVVIGKTRKPHNNQKPPSIAK